MRKKYTLNDKIDILDRAIDANRRTLAEIHKVMDEVDKQNARIFRAIEDIEAQIARDFPEVLQ